MNDDMKIAPGSLWVWASFSLSKKTTRNLKLSFYKCYLLIYDIIFSRLTYKAFIVRV